MDDVVAPHDRTNRPLVTGVGSLPSFDATEAVAFVAVHAREAPFWPQLPRRSPNEGMVAQVLGHAPIDLAWVDGRLATRPCPDELRTIIQWLKSKDAVLDHDHAAGFFALKDALGAGRFPNAQWVKGQLAGPWTIASALTSGRQEAEDSGLLNACTAYVGRLARWMAMTLADGSPPGCARLITIDEPIPHGIPALQGVHDDMAACDYLRSVYTAIRDEGAAVGVHCCGAPPFDALAASDPDVLSFDAIQHGARFFESAGAMKWLARGGRVAAGLAPTDRGLDAHEAAAAAQTWRSLADRVGADPVPWAVTATCGLGLRAPDVATAVFESTRRIAAAF